MCHRTGNLLFQDYKITNYKEQYDVVVLCPREAVLCVGSFNITVSLEFPTCQHFAVLISLKFMSISNDVISTVTANALRDVALL